MAQKKKNSFRPGERGRPWKYKVGNEIRAFGQTDFDKKTITVNKKIHKKAKKKRIYNIAKKDATLINTIAHEMEHKRYPKKSERKVEKAARRKVSKMSIKQKKKMYSKFA